MSDMQMSFAPMRELEDWELDYVSGAGNEPVVTVEVKISSWIVAGIKFSAETTTTKTKYPDGREETTTSTKVWFEVMLEVLPD